MVIPIIQLALQEVRHGEDYAHFLAARCYTQARIMLEVELVRTVIVFDNPKNYALVLYASIEPSKNDIYFALKNVFYVSFIQRKN